MTGTGGDARPNFVIMLTDDQGYHDMGCYGARGFATPNFDRMAAEGIRFTNYHSAAPTCTASRAALMTGCYGQRIGLPEILVPWSHHGISSSEQTIADLLHDAGYATACFGKWHLGHHREFLPTNHGFDEFFGLPYSNDMWPNHPVPETAAKMPVLPLMEGDKIVEFNPDQTQLTTWYTERAVDFIERNASRPFFLYVPHSMPHVPLHVSSKFKGRSALGLYGDVIMEIDWSMGQVLETLKRLGLDERTMVFFSADHGPWLEYGDHAGSAGALREGKWTTFEGGQRVACLMRWPGKIPAHQISGTMITELDILPTLVRLAGAAAPRKAIDGRDIWPVLAGESSENPHDAFYFYREEHIEGIQSGRWKLHLPHPYKRLVVPGTGGKPGRYEDSEMELSLFDIERDEGERYNLADIHPILARELAERARAFDRTLNADAREPGRVLENGVLDARRMIIYEPGIDSHAYARAERPDAHGGVELRWEAKRSSPRIEIGVPIARPGIYELAARLSARSAA
jgi:arylsulfatase A-like enzyme